jgi:hypothetical protein
MRGISCFRIASDSSLLKGLRINMSQETKILRVLRQIAGTLLFGKTRRMTLDGENYLRREYLIVNGPPRDVRGKQQGGVLVTPPCCSQSGRHLAP